MSFTLSARSEKNLVGVHPDLVRVVRRAAAECPDDISFIVTEGLRTIEKQKTLVKAGASRTMNSRHLTGHAVDIAAVVSGEVRWDFPLYTRLSVIMKQSAVSENVKIEWGGDWRSLKDGPHYQLPWKVYP
jgi:peptidoglycan L-alanyl-D-glutamate endopeptidase CwlK